MKTKMSVQPRLVLLGVVSAGALIAVVASAQNDAKKPAAAAVAPAQNQIALVISDDGLDARQPLNFYTGGVRSDLFGAPENMKVDAKPTTPKAIVPTKPLKPIETTPAVAPVSPFADYVYSGNVEVNGEKMALVENRSTRAGQYLKQGDTFIGGTISQISDRSLVIQVAGKDETLYKTDNFRLTPLSNSAAFLQNNPQQNVPGQPGALPGVPGAAPAAGAMPFPGFDQLPADRQQRIMERMNSMTPEQRAQMQERMQNRQFEGGNNNGGGRGNRGGFGGGGFGGGGRGNRGGFGGGGFGGN